MPKQEKMTLLVPADLRREARAKAIREGTTVSKLVREWLRAYVLEDKAGDQPKEAER